MRVTIEAPLRPTEDPDRVVAACTRFFPEAQAEVGPAGVRAVARDLSGLRRRVWELRIIDAFRGQALSGAAGRRLALRLSKQAAFQGRVSFPAGRAPHPLGDLTVLVDLDEDDPWADAEELVRWLAPETRDGEVVGPA